MILLQQNPSIQSGTIGILQNNLLRSPQNVVLLLGLFSRGNGNKMGTHVLGQLGERWYACQGQPACRKKGGLSATSGRLVFLDSTDPSFEHLVIKFGIDGSSEMYKFIFDFQRGPIEHVSCIRILNKDFLICG